MLLQPRPVDFRAKLEVARNRSILLTIGAIFFLTGVGIFIIFSIVFNSMVEEMPIVDYDKVAKEGTLTDGAIASIETDYHTTVNNVHPSTVKYSYRVAGSTHESKMQTLSEYANAMKPGDTVKIKHLDQWSMIDGLEPFEFPYEIFYILPAVFMVLGFPCLVIIIFQIRGGISLLRYGKVFEAEVLSAVYKQPSRKSRSGGGLLIAYRYTGDSGREYLGESLTRDLSLLHTIKQGDMIKIFVSPADESKSTLVNRLDAVRNGWNIPA